MADKNCNEAVEFMREVTDAETTNRSEAVNDLRFRYGDQWPAVVTQLRGTERPQLTINETNSYIRKITNSQRQQKPRIKVHAVDNIADPKVAEVITGITRHIEVNSDADNAYDTAFDFAVTMGWGYWRMRTDYTREDSFDQDIYVDTITNPFSVYFDKDSKLPDGSDAEKALITDLIRLAAFKRDYPGAQAEGFSPTATGDTVDWIDKDTIRIAEYMCIDRTRAKLVKLSDGVVTWDDRLPPPELMYELGLSVVGDRESFKRIVKWKKQTAFDILEEKTLPGRWIPVIPVYGITGLLEGKLRRMGLVTFARDPQVMVNYWQTSITESIALAPKAKWLMPEGGDEGHETEWNQANLSAKPVLRYKTTGLSGEPIPAPSRLQPEPPPAGAIEASFMATQNLQRALGIYDPGVRGSAQHKSGQTLEAETGQSESTNYDFYDNLTRSIKHTGRIILDWTPSIYDTQRVMRIIGDDDRPELVTINEKQQEQTPEGLAVAKILNDVTVGNYDVVMDTGPGYETKRKESLRVFTDMLGTPLGNQIAAVAGDVVVRNLDVTGADTIADRMAAANPMSEVDEESDIPPQAQMMIKGLQGKVQQLTQQLQELGLQLKFRADIEGMKQEGETKRALMNATAKAHDTEQRNLSMQHSTEVKAQAQSHDSELDAFVKVLLARVDTEKLEREIQARNVEQQAKHAENAAAPILQ